jgi:hypothetical protein
MDERYGKYKLQSGNLTEIGERLGTSDVVGVSFTVGDLITRLSGLNPNLRIFSGRNNQVGIALHHHAFVD